MRHTVKRLLNHLAWLWGMLLGALLLFSACAPEPTLMVLPTSTLIPVTATSTLTAVPVVPTNTPLPQPADINASIASATPDFVLTPVAEDIDALSSLIQQARDDLALTFNIDPIRIRPARLQRQTLFPASFACAPPTLQESWKAYQQYGMLSRYRLAMLVGSVVYTYDIAGEDLLPLCEAPQSAVDDILVRVDPVAAEMVLLAQQRLSTTLDLPQRRIQRVSVQAFTWQDTSLGCPLPDQTYEPATIDGYRIVMRVGERDYLYHTDSASLFACALEQEQLPQATTP
jgi:hypothetical protein